MWLSYTFFFLMGLLNVIHMADWVFSLVVEYLTNRDETLNKIKN